MIQASRAVKPLFRSLFIGGISILSVIAFVLVFPYVTDLFVMTLVSLTLMYVFRPGTEALERMEMSRTAAVAVLFSAVGLLVVAVVVLLFPLMVKEVVSLTRNIESVDLAATLRSVIVWINSVIPESAARLRPDPAWADAGAARLNAMLAGFLRHSTTLVSGLVNVVLLATVVPVLTFFMLKDQSSSSV